MNPIPLQANTRTRSLVARADGTPITAGTVNYYLLCNTGTNAGKWFKTSDNSWDAAEQIAAVMAHTADGVWSASVDAEAWPTAGVEYTEYAKESGDLHVPTSAIIRCEYAIASIAPGAANGLFIAGTNAATAVTTAFTANIIGDVTGNLSGSVGSGDWNTVVPDAAGVVATALGLLETHGDSTWSTAGSVTITPISSTVSAGAVISPPIVVYQYARFGPFTWTLVDDDDTPIDVSGVSLTLVVFEYTSSTSSWTYTSGAGEIVVAGAAGNQVTVTGDDTYTTSHGKYRYALIDTTNDGVLAYGDLTIWRCPSIAAAGT